jgi:tetratricopeptide (TPR) repeat protein
MVSDSGWGRIWRTFGGFGLLLVFLSSQALFAVPSVTCPNGEVRSLVDARELASRYEAGSMADTLSGLSVLGAARTKADSATLQQAAVATWRWNQLLQGLADRYNRCLLTREQYAQAVGKVYPRLREDAADLQVILRLLAQGKPVEEKRLGILLDSYSANLRRFAELSGQDVLLDRIAAVVEREGGGGDQAQILDSLANTEKSLKEAPPLAEPEAAEERIAKELAKSGSHAAEDYRKGFELYQRYRFEESVPFFERALAEARIPELYAALGRALLQVSQLDRAEAAFRQGLALARREKDAEREAELAFGLGEATCRARWPTRARAAPFRKSCTGPKTSERFTTTPSSARS